MSTTEQHQTMSETGTVNWTFDLAGELTHRYDAVHWFPFIEDESGNITGPGHQHKESFLRLVDHYDEVATGEEGMTGSFGIEHVQHRWVVFPEATAEKPEGLLIVQDVTESTPGAVPVTTLWGAR